MKYLKMLGLVALAATALMAFAASSASADVLCKAAPNASGECATASGDYASGTVFTAESSNPVLTVVGSGIANQVTCEKSNVALKSTSTGSNTPGTAVTAEVTQVSFTGNCKTDTGLNCTVTETKGYTGTLKATNDKGNGTAVTNGAIKTRVVCGGFFACEYEPTAAGIDLSFTGGNPATEVASNQPLTHVPGGIGCGTESKWDATYTATGTNKAVWVATKNA